MSTGQPSIPEKVAERARRQPDDDAYTFMDYDVNSNGFAEKLTWSQVDMRSRAVAEQLKVCGKAGDRAAILAPQGLEYIVAFFGAMQAGFIAVPLSVPQPGGHDERVSGALCDCSPAVILTTSAVVDAVMPYAGPQPGGSAPAVVEVDALDLDSPRPVAETTGEYCETAYLQYTSGSTRRPAGVAISHANVLANLEQIFADYFDEGRGAPPDLTFVSWLPFYHDMGLIQGVFAPLLTATGTPGETRGTPAVLMSPTGFLQRPSRWVQLLAKNGPSWSASPNFAFELAARRTTDEDMAGLDLSGLMGIISGSERIHAATMRRFIERFSAFNIRRDVVLPSYGLAEATLYVTSTPQGHTPATARFDYEKLGKGYAKRCAAEAGTELVSYGPPRAVTLRIVDPETRTENPAEKVGEIWVHGDHVASGYWKDRQASERTFGATLVHPTSGTPHGPWLRTGDLGVMSGGELFIVGRIKDLLIVNGRNHYPDDIEATIQEITGGRVAAVSVPDDQTEQLVAIAEVKQKGAVEEDDSRLRTVKRAVTSAISKSHSLRVADLVLVPPGSLPTTTSGKVRRSACVEKYLKAEFARLDATA